MSAARLEEASMDDPATSVQAAARMSEGRSPDERSDIRGSASAMPACRCAHAGYALKSYLRYGFLFQANSPSTAATAVHKSLITLRPYVNSGRGLGMFCQWW